MDMQNLRSRESDGLRSDRLLHIICFPEISGRRSAGRAKHKQLQWPMAIGFEEKSVVQTAVSNRKSQNLCRDAMRYDAICGLRQRG